MLAKYLLSKTNLEYETKDYLSKAKLDLIRFHIHLQILSSIFLIAYSLLFKFKVGSIYGQLLIIFVMFITYFILLKDRHHKRVSILLVVFYTIVVAPSVNFHLGSFHVLPVMMSLYAIALTILLFEDKLRQKMIILYGVFSIPLIIKDMIVITNISGLDVAFNRLISLLLAFVLIIMTIWVFKDSVVILSTENYNNSIIDRLTGVHNFYSFEKEMKKNINIYNRYDENFAMAMIDIDNFKKINDTFGHQNGDEFLKKFVNHVTKYIRQEDFLARYGGDEFIILFPRSDKELAIKVIERLYNDSLNYINAYQEQGVTFSCGISDYKESIYLEKDIVFVADSRMYQAKDKGKNRYVA